MVRLAGAKFPPEYSEDRNLTVKTQCVIQMWLSGNCIASPVVSVGSKTWHGSGCISICPASFIRVTVTVTDPHSTEVGSLSHISPWHLTVSECLSWPAVMTISLALWVLELSNFSAWNTPLRAGKMGSPYSVVRHLIQGTENMWRYLAVISSCHQNRLF